MLAVGRGIEPLSSHFFLAYMDVDKYARSPQYLFIR